MTRLEPAGNAEGLRAFHRLPREVYRSFPNHRATDDEIAHMLVGGRSLFHAHATVVPYLIRDGDRVVGRFALIRDQKRPEYVQIAFFEALPGVTGFLEPALAEARARFPAAERVVAGLNGHLNYSAGFLADHFDEPPVFGLPYTPPYYLDCFAPLERRDMVSFRFETEPFYARLRKAGPAKAFGPVRVRCMDRRNLAREVELYTALNNACFQQHPYWADRTAEEDFELLNPFRFFIGDEHLLFAEVDGRPVGFLLWYPDFNELAGPGEPLGLKHLVRYKVLRRKPRALRLTEIAVIDEYRDRALVIPALLQRLIEVSADKGYLWCEGGFIFTENQACVSATVHSLARGLGREPPPYRRYCVFEAKL